VQKIQISRIDVSTQTLEQKTDLVAEETPLHIFLNQIHYATILCSPDQLKELVLGHLLSEGILKSTDEILEIRWEEYGKCLVRLRPDIDAEKRVSTSQPFARLIVSACGSPDYWPLSKLIDRISPAKLNLGFTLEARIISESVRQLYLLAEKFRTTGGVHIAALYSRSGESLASSEDVGRHNAVDKVIGAGTVNKLNLRNLLLALSGRLTGDIVLKAARMGIPIVASMAAAINSGVEAAQLTGVTLIGFVRGKRINVYTYPERILRKS
jgi:FdhD protein